MSQTKAQLIDGKSAEIEFTGGSASGPAISFTGDSNTGIYSPGADQVAVATNGTGRLFVASDGKIGIGGTPSNPLDVFGSATLGIRYKSSGSYAGILADNTSSTGGGYFGAYQNGTQKAIFGVTAAFIGDTSGDAAIFAETGHSIRFFTNGSVTEKMRITDAGLVGIGTSSPGSFNSFANNLVVGTGTGANGITIYAGNTSTSSLNFADGTSGNDLYPGYIMYNHADDSLSFIVNYAGSAPAKMFISSAGNVGLGTTAPDVLLTTKVASGPIARFRTADTNFFGIDIGTDGTTQTFIESVKGGSGSYQPLAFWMSGVEKARIDTSGRLLVGTSSSPSLTNGQYAKAHFVGNTFAATGDAALNLGRGVLASSGIAADTSLGSLHFTDSAGAIHATINGATDAVTGSNDYPGRLVFSTTADGASSPTERMRISSVGNLMVGTTTGSVTNGGLFYFSPAATAEPRLLLGHATGTGSGAPYVNFLFNAASIGSITQSGTTAVAYNTTSDYRLKENVTAFTDGIARLHQLKPCRFNFIAESERLVDGFLAHEVQTIVPEAITGEKDAVDDEGNPEYQGIDQSKLVPLLTAALQEAIAKIESLEARLTAAGL